MLDAWDTVEEPTKEDPPLVENDGYEEVASPLVEDDGYGGYDVPLEPLVKDDGCYEEVPSPLTPEEDDGCYEEVAPPVENLEKTVNETNAPEMTGQVEAPPESPEKEKPPSVEVLADRLAAACEEVVRKKAEKPHADRELKKREAHARAAEVNDRPTTAAALPQWGSSKRRGKRHHSWSSWTDSWKGGRQRSRSPPPERNARAPIRPTCAPQRAYDNGGDGCAKRQAESSNAEQLTGELMKWQAYCCQLQHRNQHLQLQHQQTWAALAAQQHQQQQMKQGQQQGRRKRRKASASSSSSSSSSRAPRRATPRRAAPTAPSPAAAPAPRVTVPRAKAKSAGKSS